jgi:hypothetical protein
MENTKKHGDDLWIIHQYNLQFAQKISLSAALCALCFCGE